MIMSFKIARLFRSLCLSSLLLVKPALAEINVEQLISTLPQGASAAFIAKNLDTNQIITQYQSETFMLPASTQKVFTALAAKLALDEDFRFQTALLTQGTMTQNTLNGNLIVKFSGDPNLTSGQLFQLFSELKKQGVQQINGDLILDTSVFAGHDKASGWIWNDLTMCFNAPPAAINIDHNCFYVNLNANQEIGEYAKVEVPSAYPVQVFSSAYIVKKEDAPYCQLDVIAHDNNRYQVKGCMARLATPFGLSFSVQDPTAYGANIIQADLKKLGIKFSGKVKEATTAQQGQILAEHFSAPLPELLKKMMKKSDN